MPFQMKELEPHPKDGYPFHEDYISTGAKLSQCVVIDENFQPELTDMFIMHGGRLAEGLYLVNAKTGERIQIVYTFPYDEEIPDYGTVFTVEEFTAAVDDGGFINYDGQGYPCKDGKMMGRYRMLPSQIGRMPEDATHFVWFNK